MEEADGDYSQVSRTQRYREINIQILNANMKPRLMKIHQPAQRMRRGGVRETEEKTIFKKS